MLFKVNYQFVAPNSALRGAALVVEAIDAETAKAGAAALIPSGHKYPKILSAAEYSVGVQADLFQTAIKRRRKRSA